MKLRCDTLPDNLKPERKFNTTVWINVNGQRTLGVLDYILNDPNEFWLYKIVLRTGATENSVIPMSQENFTIGEVVNVDYSITTSYIGKQVA